MKKPIQPLIFLLGVIVYLFGACMGLVSAAADSSNASWHSSNGTAIYSDIKALSNDVLHNIEPDTQGLDPAGYMSVYDQSCNRYLIIQNSQCFSARGKQVGVIKNSQGNVTAVQMECAPSSLMADQHACDNPTFTAGQAGPTTPQLASGSVTITASATCGLNGSFIPNVSLNITDQNNNLLGSGQTNSSGPTTIANLSNQKSGAVLQVTPDASSVTGFNLGASPSPQSVTVPSFLGSSNNTYSTELTFHYTSCTVVGNGGSLTQLPTKTTIPASYIYQLEQQIYQNCGNYSSSPECIGQIKKDCFGAKGIDTSLYDTQSKDVPLPDTYASADSAKADVYGCIYNHGYSNFSTPTNSQAGSNQTGGGSAPTSGGSSSGTKVTAAWLSYPYEKGVFDTSTRQQIYDANTGMNNTTFTIPGALPQPSCPTQVYDMRLSVFHGDSDPTVYHYKLTYNCPANTDTTNSATNGSSGTAGTNPQTGSSGGNSNANQDNSGPSCTYSQSCGNGGVQTCPGKFSGGQCKYAGGQCDPCKGEVSSPNRVCAPGSYDVQCTGKCVNGCGEAAIRQCSSDGTSWSGTHGECSSKCSQYCSGGSAPQEGSSCTYPEACPSCSGGVHVCSGTIQGGICKYDPSVAPNCQ